MSAEIRFNSSSGNVESNAQAMFEDSVAFPQSSVPEGIIVPLGMTVIPSRIQ